MGCAWTALHVHNSRSWDGDSCMWLEQIQRIHVGVGLCWQIHQALGCPEPSARGDADARPHICSSTTQILTSPRKPSCLMLIWHDRLFVGLQATGGCTSSTSEPSHRICSGYRRECFGRGFVGQYCMGWICVCLAAGLGSQSSVKYQISLPSSLFLEAPGSTEVCASIQVSTLISTLNHLCSQLVHEKNISGKHLGSSFFMWGFEECFLVYKCFGNLSKYLSHHKASNQLTKIQTTFG